MVPAVAARVIAVVVEIMCFIDDFLFPVGTAEICVHTL